MLNSGLGGLARECSHQIPALYLTQPAASDLSIEFLGHRGGSAGGISLDPG